MSTTLVVSSSGSHPFRVPVVILEGETPLDPTSFPISFAFPVEGSEDPADGEYTAGTWETVGNRHWGRGVIKDLTDGRYDLWVWVNGGASASPRSKVGVVIVT